MLFWNIFFLTKYWGRIFPPPSWLVQVFFLFKVALQVPWIPEPSTVNNKLKRREGSGSTGTFFD